MAEREAEMERKLEERLTTAAERDAYAREKIKQELVQLTLEGTAQELKDRLEEFANEAMDNKERPRGSVGVRDERGNTLLLLAVWKNRLETIEMLLTHWTTLDEEFDKIERRVFWCNINARDAKGWSACALAVFHGHKHALEMLLKHGADPYIKNSYGKSAFEFAQDDKDAARKVTVDRSEIRGVLTEWEREQNPRAAEQREREEAQLQACKCAKKEGEELGVEDEKGAGGAGIAAGGKGQAKKKKPPTKAKKKKK